MHTARYRVSARTRFYDFVVDCFGRTKRTEGLLGNPNDGRILKLHNPNAQRRLSHGQRNYHAGHSFGKQFGGPGEFPNVVLMKRTMNRTGGSCYKMESEPNELADQHKVRLVVNLHYRGKSGIPKSNHCRRILHC